MGDSLSRRRFLASGAAAILAAGPAMAQSGGEPVAAWMSDPSLLPPPESNIDYPIEPVNLRQIPEQFRRQIVSYAGPVPAGTIVVDPGHRFLYWVLEDNQAIRYGVGVGREGFAWSGEAEVRMKRRWPRWVPPPEMVQRDKNARKWANGMPGGPDNPLGARALYLYSQTLYAGFADSGYRLHGTNEPHSIGKAMSSGCIRMLNQDIAEVFDRSPVGTRVIVLSVDETAGG